MASGPAAAAAPAREKCIAEKDLPRTVKWKKTAGRQPKPKPLVVGEALTATQSQTCIASGIPAAPSPRAKPATQATGETETAADPTSPIRDVGPSIDTSSVAQAGMSAAETSAAGAAPSSVAAKTQTQPQATEVPQQLATQAQGPPRTANDVHTAIAATAAASYPTSGYAS
ncbi:uncharacterized protein LOC104583365 [Brachypodium distachyon]|uniref:uncharacterized protein LOC104583365 n=1 Tax=Brachypodium distachyon TaxID=15368 RepID=UPI000530013A|nr:uncharacterized protein LOC104583365 [Brachypodium distachyon]|eukprot:XP_010233582.1 uncharacterized protein LOC104583365 [Brachypodium distachyon]